MQGSVYNAGLTTGPTSTLLALFCTSILALCLAVCWYQWKLIRAYKHFPSQRMDTKRLLPIIMGKYSKDVPITCVFFQELIEGVKAFQREGLCVLWFVRPYLVIYNEEYNKVLLHDSALIDKNSTYVALKEFFGNGLLGSEENVWKVHRKLLNPAFYVGALKAKMSIFNENAVSLVEKLRSVEGKPTEELIDILKYCAFNVLSESILGLKMSDEKFGSKIVHYMENIEKGAALGVYRMAHPWLYWKFLLPFFHSGRRYLQAHDKVQGFTNEVIEKLKKSVIVSEEMDQHLNSEVEARKSIAQILIEHHLKDSIFTTEDVRDHLNNFMSAGHDTTSYTLLWCFYLLGQHPQVQEYAFEEVESVVKGKDVTFDDLGNLKYLDCVIKETLRLYPTIPMFGRKANREIQCGQFKIPKGTDIIFFPFMTHRNPDLYPDPEKFDPQRFSENSEIRPWMHIPFAEGYRNCIGKKFAMMEMKVVLVHVLRHFKLTSMNKIDDSDLDWIIYMKPSKSIRMLFTVRQPQS